MSESDGGHPVVVNVGSCRCPGTPHDPAGDTVSLVPRLTVPMGAAAWIGMDAEHSSVPAVQASLIRVFLSPEAAGGAIVAWSFVDAAGATEPVTPENVERLIPWGNGGMEVAEQVDDLYGAELMAPFLARLQRRSPTTPMDASTPATPFSGPRSPTPSRPSSRTKRAAGKLSAVPGR
jgi:hypothetical protein